MSIWVAELYFDEDNEDELWRHRISDVDALAVLESGRRVFLRNKRRRPGTHKMIGPDRKGRLLTIVVSPLSRKEGLWRPITGWPSTRGEETLWRRHWR